MNEEIEGPVSLLAESIASRLERLAAGEPLDSVLAGADAEVADQVRLAAALGEVLPQQPSPAFRAALQVRLQTAMDGASRSSWTRAGSARRSWIGRIAPRVAGSILALFLVFATAAVAAADSLPGDALYRVKRISEEARVVLMRDSDSRARFRLELADERLEEIRRLIELGSPLSPDAVDSLVAQQQLARDAGVSGSAAVRKEVDEWANSRSAVLLEWAGTDGSTISSALRRAAGLLHPGANAVVPGTPPTPRSAPVLQSPELATLRARALATALAGSAITPSSPATAVVPPARSPTAAPARATPSPYARTFATATTIPPGPIDPAVTPLPPVELTPGPGGSSDPRPGRATELARRTQMAPPTPEDGSAGDAGEPTAEPREPTPTSSG